MTLERARLGLLAALAATIPVSIFASQMLLALSLVVLLARLLRRRTSLPRTPLDGPLLALVVWTLLAASFAAEPAVAHEESKKLLLFALFYLAVEGLAPGGDRERVLAAALLGGLALAALMVLQRYALGYDGLMRRPPGFLGHYMSASGVTMAILLLAVARLATGPRARPRPMDLWLAAAVLAGVSAVALATARGHGVLATRLFVAALAAAAVALARPAPRAHAPPRPPCPSSSSRRRVGAPGLADAQRLDRSRGRPRGARGARAAARAASAVGGARRGRRAPAREPRRDPLAAHRARREQPRSLLHVAGRPRHGAGAAGLRAGAGHGRGRLPALPLARGAEPAPAAPAQQRACRSPPSAGCPGSSSSCGGSACAFLAALREAQRAAAAGRGPGWAAAGALAALAAVFVAGLFEYNLGDSEVLMLVLLLTAVPFAKSSDGAQA